MKRPRVTTNCVASRYTQKNERIIEFSSDNGGGLISFLATDDGRLLVDVYNQDSSVEVRVGGAKDSWKEKP